MTIENLEIYFKDLKASVQKKIKKFMDDRKITGMEAIYESNMPFYIFVTFDEGDMDDTSKMDGMVS